MPDVTWTTKEAVTRAYYELAALIPRPDDPQLEDMTAVTQANNPADAVCLLQAYNWLRIALGKDVAPDPPRPRRRGDDDGAD